MPSGWSSGLSKAGSTANTGGPRPRTVSCLATGSSPAAASLTRPTRPRERSSFSRPDSPERTPAALVLARPVRRANLALTGNRPGALMTGGAHAPTQADPPPRAGTAGDAGGAVAGERVRRPAAHRALPEQALRGHALVPGRDVPRRGQDVRAAGRGRRAGRDRGGAGRAAGPAGRRAEPARRAW